MSEGERARFWDGVYATKAPEQLSWSQGAPADIGGGASRLVDHLLARGFDDVSVLDVSREALAKARARLGEAGDRVAWIVADVTRWEPMRGYDVWHDRAALHFLTHEEDQRAYVERLKRALTPGGRAILGAFAPDGPEKCSGLPVARHDSHSLAALLGDDFAPNEERRHDHVTPWGSVQKFQFSLFTRR
jgi:SAM-dependent methyltransferase